MAQEGNAPSAVGLPCLAEPEHVRVESDERGLPTAFRIEPALVEARDMRGDFEHYLLRYLKGGDVVTAAGFFQWNAPMSLRVFDQIRRVLGSEQLAARRNRTLETDRIPLRAVMWDYVLHNRYVEVRLLYSWFVERRHDGIVPLLHFIMSAPDLDMQERLIAAGFLARLEDESGREFVRQVYDEPACAEHRRFIDRELAFAF